MCCSRHVQHVVIIIMFNSSHEVTHIQVLTHPPIEEKELRSPQEAEVDKMSVCRTSQAMPYGNSFGCKTTLPFA